MNAERAASQPASASSGWSAWQPLGWEVNPEVLAETLDGGQTFRWRHEADGTWTGRWAEHVARLRQTGAPVVECALPRGTPAVVDALRRYLALDTDFAALTDTLPWRSDPHLTQCVRAYPGLRIPRQPFGETLLCFLCSATKQIVQIKQMVALLAERHGAPLVSPASPVAHHPSLLHCLPTWPELAQVPEADLRRCLLGFRARFIAETARHLAAQPGWLEETEQLPYAAAKARLLELPGVGEKVADCVLLFGAGRLEAFPVDTWILQAMARRYGLGGWKPAQIAHFGRTHFGPLAGLAQQYLFAWERRAARQKV
ncbi:MAG: DNA-3-methyladenine glycosylase family protein [Opitutales bacterium]